MPIQSRREFLSRAALASTGLAVLPAAGVAQTPTAEPEPIIDIHQHTPYTGRTDEQLVAHQLAMGVTHSILLPAGRYFGLEAQCGGNDRVQSLTKQFPDRFSFFSNEVSYLPDARREIERNLKLGAIGIGEQKFMIEADSKWIRIVAEIAQEFQVPVLMHFQFGKYNTGIEHFHKILEKYPKVNFIGHAQTWWANIDAKCEQKLLYPLTKVTPGGITDKLLSDYPNVFADMSAGSGLNALIRDEDHARGFIERHQDKLMFGSDCNDAMGRGPRCQGAQILAGIRRLTPDAKVRKKLLYSNARRVMKLNLPV